MSGTATYHPAGSKRWNALSLSIEHRIAALRTRVQQMVYADGPPPFSADVTKGQDTRVIYDHLVALRAANSPLYWGDPSAIKQLAQLIPEYGPPPAPAPPPFLVPQATPQSPIPGRFM